MEANAALEVWAAGAPYPFKWTALWPLVAIATERKDVSAITKCLQQLLDPSQQLLPPELIACVTEVIAAHESLRNEQALDLADRAVQLARKFKYL